MPLRLIKVIKREVAVATQKAARRRPLADDEWRAGYFFGVSTGVGTLSMTEDELRMLVM